MNKQHILEEIKRTASANGGVPLGKDRFFKETGIKDTDWFGKIWARWGDAVREAGLSPNELKTAYDEQFLLDKFISLMRELGHFPVKGEIRLKTRNEDNFPADTTFTSRLGTKRQTASKLVEYCKQHEGHDDVLAICESILEQSVSEQKEAPLDDVVMGYIYLIKVGHHYKVGRSNAVGRREYELAIQLPEKGETIHTIRTDDPIGIEAYWHKRFETKRKNGEWFELTSADVSAFKRRKFM